MLAIVCNGKVIGQVYLNLDPQNVRAELGYSLSRKHWGKGLATEAAHAVMNWGFQTYGLNKVYATCDPRNERSRRVLRKLGMTEEGLLRQHLKWQGEFRDALHYGILRSEWEGNLTAPK
jgi:RimJ/RimL family protein N-acetyltransferase